ncbi:MAG: DUF3143 domain-containing protein [Snowella sp.]|nr:DUF3143 domain-containing protein [Snowella sp.]
MDLPSADTPLYNHPLSSIENWLINLGCQQDPQNRHCWQVKYPAWQAELSLDIEELTVRYFQGESGENDIRRTFKYSLSRQDIEDAVFSGP